MRKSVVGYQSSPVQSDDALGVVRCPMGLDPYKVSQTNFEFLFFFDIEMLKSQGGLKQ